MKNQEHVPGVPGVVLEHVLCAGQVPQGFPQLSELQFNLVEHSVRGTHVELTDLH